jgi:hypothetical protein|tara:strand:- start:158 stop:379 length:222 start_codon:yes stop_codon:yes gene_type:complete
MTVRRDDTFDLTDSDRSSATWQKLYDAYTSRLASLRMHNDKDQDATTTAFIRGQIKEVKRVLELNIPDDQKRR